MRGVVWAVGGEVGGAVPGPEPGVGAREERDRVTNQGPVPAGPWGILLLLTKGPGDQAHPEEGCKAAQEGHRVVLQQEGHLCHAKMTRPKPTQGSQLAALAEAEAEAYIQLQPQGQGLVSVTLKQGQGLVSVLLFLDLRRGASLTHRHNLVGPFVWLWLLALHGAKVPPDLA